MEIKILTRYKSHTQKQHPGRHNGGAALDTVTEGEWKPPVCGPDPIPGLQYMIGPRKDEQCSDERCYGRWKQKGREKEEE